MRTKDELFREALRHIAARRQQAVTAAARDRAAGLPPAARTRPPQPQH